MRHKSSAKKSLCQDLPETPEQKEIRLLKKKLKYQVSLETSLRKWWAEERGEHTETKKQLTYAEKCIEADKSTNSIYKSLYESSQIYYDVYKRWYEEEQKRSAEWKEKYDTLLASMQAGNSSNSAGEAVDRGVEKCIEIMHRIGELTNRNKKQIEEEDEEKKFSSGPIPANSGDVRLICINIEPITYTRRDGTTNTGHGTGLEFLDRYTSPGMIISEDGSENYPINEMGGELKLAKRFHVCEDQPVKKRGRKKTD